MVLVRVSYDPDNEMLFLYSNFVNQQDENGSQLRRS